MAVHVQQTERFILLHDKESARMTYVLNVDGPDWNTVTIYRVYKNRTLETMKVSRDEARKHYRARLREGFYRLDF